MPPLAQSVMHPWYARTAIWLDEDLFGVYCFCGQGSLCLFDSGTDALALAGGCVTRDGQRNCFQCVAAASGRPADEECEKYWTEGWSYNHYLNWVPWLPKFPLALEVCVDYDDLSGLPPPFEWTFGIEGPRRAENCIGTRHRPVTRQAAPGVFRLVLDEGAATAADEGAQPTAPAAPHTSEMHFN
jgi:hypothetical protein